MCLDRRLRVESQDALMLQIGRLSRSNRHSQQGLALLIIGKFGISEAKDFKMKK